MNQYECQTALAEHTWPYVAEQFRGYGGTILHTTLSKEKAANVQSALAGKR